MHAVRQQGYHSLTFCSKLRSEVKDSVCVVDETTALSAAPDVTLLCCPSCKQTSNQTQCNPYDWELRFCQPFPRAGFPISQWVLILHHKATSQRGWHPWGVTVRGMGGKSEGVTFPWGGHKVLTCDFTSRGGINHIYFITSKTLFHAFFKGSELKRMFPFVSGAVSWDYTAK